MKYLISIIAALALVGCEQSPTALDPTSSPKAPYQAFSMASDGFRLIPGGKTLWDTGFHDVFLPDRRTHTKYDTAKEVLVSIDSLYVDTAWGVISNPAFRGESRIVDAILAANAKSKLAGLDTVYQYTGKNSIEYYTGYPYDTLVSLSVRIANGYRLPSPREAKYLLWAGSQLKRPWGVGDIPKSWAENHLYGDSASGIRNDFGVYVFFQIPGQPAQRSVFCAVSLETDYSVSQICPPSFSPEAYTSHFAALSRSWKITDASTEFAPVVFVRSK